MTLTRIIADIPLERLINLARFTQHDDPRVQHGAVILWETLIEEFFGGLYPRTANSLEQTFKALRLDWKPIFALLKQSDTATRKRGITLLTLSNFPIAEKNYRDELLQLLSKTEDTEEITAWAFFLQHFSTDMERPDWQAALIQILDQPQSYTSSILRATKERYAELVGEPGPGIKGNEKLLWLPEID